MTFMSRHRASSAVLQRYPLAFLPTPVEPAPRLAAELGGIDLQVKREDQSGLALGGNKPRQLEVIVADAIRNNADWIVTTAGSQSNFCRAMAAAAARAGMGCTLLLRRDGNDRMAGNLFLDHLLGADIHWIDTTDPYDDRVRLELEALAGALAASGHHPYLVQLPGVTGPLAAAAAMSLAEEIIDECGTEPARVYLAVGSGLTAAGLLAGFAAAGTGHEVVGISVQQKESFIRPLILERAQQALALVGADVKIDPSRLVIDDGHIGPGYAKASHEGLTAIHTAARLAGLLLDPAYSGKAMAGLIAHAREGRAGPRTIFVHTGGTPGLFAEAGAIMGNA